MFNCRPMIFHLGVKNACFGIEKGGFTADVAVVRSFNFQFQVVLEHLLKTDNCKQIAQKFRETIDIDLIKQQIEQGSFDIYQYSNFIIDTLSKVCAPCRDERMAELRKIKDVVLLFRLVHCCFPPHNLLCRGRKITIWVAFFQILTNLHFITPFKSPWPSW